MLSGEQLFGNHLLNFEYILLDVNRFNDAELLGLANTIGAAFLLDKNSRNKKDFRKLLRDLLMCLQNTTEAELIIFLRWLRYIIKPRLSPDQQEIFETELNQLESNLENSSSKLNKNPTQEKPNNNF